eukprot:777308-Prymnesium_polylepis.1
MSRSRSRLACEPSWPPPTSPSVRQRTAGWHPGTRPTPPPGPLPGAVRPRGTEARYTRWPARQAAASHRAAAARAAPRCPRPSPTACPG